MTPTTTTNRPSKDTKARRLGKQFEPRRVMIVPERLDAPKPIAKAAARARAALDELESVRKLIPVAEEEARIAADRDAAAAVHAVENAEPVPDRTHPAKLRALDDARRTEQARCKLAIAAIEEQADAMTDDWDEFVEGLQATRDAARSRILEIAAELRELFAALRDADEALSATEHFTGWAGTFLLPNPPSPEREAHRYDKAQERFGVGLQQRMSRLEGPYEIVAQLMWLAEGRQ